MNVLITGASSGLGLHIAQKMAELNFSVMNWSDGTSDTLNSTIVDLVVERSIDRAIDRLSGQGFSPIDILINCAGVNEIGYLADTDTAAWDEVMDVNAKAIFLVTRNLIRAGHLKGGTILNIVSNASHVPMTASIAYNASKGAAAIMTKQMARELGKTHDITVFGISPNKLAGTGMSKYIEKRVCQVRGWTPEQAQAYQLAALPAGEETDPKVLADFIGYLLSTKKRHKYLAGCDIPYGA